MDVEMKISVFTVDYHLALFWTNIYYIPASTIIRLFLNICSSSFYSAIKYI